VTLQQIRNDVRFRNIPVIAIYSTSSAIDGIKDTYGLGANAYIVKPISFNDLKTLLKKVVEIDWTERLEQRELESFIIKV